MRLPDIVYGNPVEKRGRYGSKAPQIVLQTAQMAAKGKSEEGRLLSGAERNAGQMVSDAMRQAARTTSQAELDAEKFKNDKIAKYSIEAAKFDIESKLEGDVLKIKEDRDKYILDREYERDLNILGIKSALEKEKFAIQSASQWRKLDINNQLKLEILDIQSDAAWRQTLLGIGKNLATTAFNAWLTNENTKNEAEVFNRASTYDIETARVAAEISNTTMIDIDDERYADLDLENRISQKVMDNVKEVRNDDGTISRMVPTHEVGEIIYQAKAEQLRGVATTGLDSTSHLEDLSLKLDNIDGKRVIPLIKDFAEKARNWDAALFEQTIDDYIEAGNLDEAVKSTNKAVSLGVFSQSRGAEKIKQANIQIKYSDFLNRIDGASTKAILENIKGEVNGSGLPETRINQLRSAISNQDHDITTQGARTLYENQFPGVMAQSRPVGALPNSAEYQGGKGYAELEAQVVSTMEAAGYEPDLVAKYKDEFSRDYNAVRERAMELPNAVNEEASTYWDQGIEYPTAGNQAYEQLDEKWQKKIDKKNSQMRKGGKLSTDWNYYGEMMDAAMDEKHPMHKEFLGANFYSIDDKSWDKLAPSQRKELRSLQLEVKKGEASFALTDIKITDSLFKRHSELAFGDKIDEQEFTRQNQLRHVINNRIRQVEFSQDKPLTENQKMEVMDEVFNADITERRKQRGYMPKQQPYYEVDTPFREGRVADSMVYLSDQLVQTGIPATPENITSLYNMLSKQILKTDPKKRVTPQAVRTLFERLQASNVAWFEVR